MLAFGIVGFGLQHCKDEPLCNDPSNPQCPNYNPCYGKKSVTADFEMSQMFAVVTPDYLDKFNPDIAFERDRIGFRPIGLDTATKYTWLLGSEIITEPSFERNFANTQQTGENNIQITLIIEKKPNLICFPNDDGRDTITKHIRFVESPCEYLTSGDFKVLFEGDKDSTIVGVRNWHQPVAGSRKPIDDSCRFRRRVLLGFDHNKIQQDTGWDGSDGYQFNSKIIFAPSLGGGTEGTAYNGYFKIDPLSLKIEGEHQILYPDTKFSKKYRFKGRKIK